MKLCRFCDTSKPLEDFYAHPKTRDGFGTKCKECSKLYAKNRLKGPDAEKIRKADRDRSRDNEKRNAMMRESYRKAKSTDPERMNSYSKNWIARNPEKRKAHTAVGNAVRAGRLIKGPCEFCGTTDKVQAHHDDYAKPLEVRWVCRKHHGILHRKEELHEG